MASNFSIELFKVPFDNSYKKVFDIGSQIDNINSYKVLFHDIILKNTENYISILSPEVSNIKRYNNNIILTIRKSYFEIRDYNYISLKYGNIYYFYFINEMVSENDNPVNPSCTLTCEWDCWHNHLDDIYLQTNKVSNIETVIQSHKKRNFFDDKGNAQRIFYKNDINKVSTYKEVYNDDKKVLFLKLIVDEQFYTLIDTTFIFNDTIHISTGKTGNIIPTTTRTFKNVVYIPIGVRTGVGENSIITDFDFKTHPNGTITIYKGTQPVEILNVNSLSAKSPFNIYSSQIDDKYTSYIVSAELTYNSPVKYTVDTTHRSVTFYTIGGICESIFRDRVDNYLTPNMLIFVAPSEFTYNNNNYITVGWSFDREITDIELSGYNLLPQPDIINRKVEDKDRLEDEPMLYNYPFKYYSVYYNNTEIPIENIYKSNVDTKTLIKFDNKTNQTNFKIIANNKQLNNGNIYLKTNGLMTLSKDALQDYLIRNGAQEQTSLSLKLLSNIPNMFIKPSFGGISNSATEIFSLMAKHADLQTTPDSVQLNNRGEDDLIIQDSLIIYINSVKDNVLEDYYKNYYMYGYKYPENIEIFDNVRYWFDYKKTVNCKINNKINLNDKKRIEQMFDDGVHMFHINYVVAHDNYKVNTTMEFDYKNNIERNIGIIL